VPLFSKFFGKTIGEAAAFALGGAMRSPLEPPLVELTNETWAKFVDTGITIPTDPGDAAEIAAEDAALVTWAKTQAKQRGIGGDQMNKLIAATRTAPSVGELRTMWRRGDISEADFEHGLRKARLETRWDEAERKAKVDRLSPEDVARMIQRGLIPDPGILPVGPPAGVGNVRAFPVFDIDAYSEALASGVDQQRLGALTGLVGNPMGAHEAAQAEFRGILTDDDYRRAIAEGNTRNEWADAIHEQSRQIPSVTNYVDAFVRDWIKEPEFLAGAARHGMTPEDADLLFLTHGRPLSWHQVWIGLARGGKYDGPMGDIDPAFLKSLRESNIRPEWYALAWAQRYTYPSAFVLRGMAQAGDLTQSELHTILLYIGWEPTFAERVSKRWAQAATGGAGALTAKAQTQLWTATHRAFVNADMTEAAARDELAAIGADAADTDAVLALWSREREVRRLDLSPSQIKKAYANNVFTRLEAIARLERQGMSASDAAVLLDE
jgi:hypothetical protein